MSTGSIIDLGSGDRSFIKGGKPHPADILHHHSRRVPSGKPRGQRWQKKKKKSDQYICLPRAPPVQTLADDRRRTGFRIEGWNRHQSLYRDLPRLSVDIDLNLPSARKPRDECSGRKIDAILDRVAARRLKKIKASKVKLDSRRWRRDDHARRGKARARPQSRSGDLPVARGTAHPVERRRVSERVEDQLGFAEMQVVAFEDLFGGKMACSSGSSASARSLRHQVVSMNTRDSLNLLFRTFLVYVASSGRPPHELQLNQG